MVIRSPAECHHLWAPVETLFIRTCVFVAFPHLGAVSSACMLAIHGSGPTGTLVYRFLSPCCTGNEPTACNTVASSTRCPLQVVSERNQSTLWLNFVFPLLNGKPSNGEGSTSQVCTCSCSNKRKMYRPSHCLLSQEVKSRIISSW
jgi:hypothetical protein